MPNPSLRRVGPYSYEVYGRCRSKRHRRRFTPRNSSNPQRDAQDYYDNIKFQIQISVNNTKKVLILDYIRIYLRHCEANNTWATVKSDAGRLKIFSEWASKNGVKWLSELDHATIDRFCDYYRLERRGRNPNNYISCIHSLLTYAVRHGAVMENPLSGYRKQKRRIDEAQYFTLDEISRLLAVASRPYPHDFLIFLLQTGCRLSEAVNMRWADVDFDHRRITIRSRLNSPTKSGKARTIPLTDTLFDTLDSKKDRPTIWIFPSNRGKPRRNQTNHKMFNDLLDVAVIDKNGRSLKSLRHTFVTHLFNQGQPLELISKIVGHQSPAITAQVYAHLIPGSLDIIKKLPY